MNSKEKLQYQIDFYWELYDQSRSQKEKIRLWGLLILYKKMLKTAK